MKKVTKIAFLILIVIIIVLGIALYSKANNNNEDTSQKDKTYSEIKYLESKLTDLFNSMNNIEFENYDISIGEIKSESGGKSGSGSSSTSGGGASSGSGEESSSEEESSGSSSAESSSSGSDSLESNQSSEKENKKFDLKSSGVLVNEEDINWNNVKTEIEVMYTSVPTILLDLYQLDLNEEDVSNFSKKYDDLIKAVREEDKEKTLENLSNLYDYIPKFANNSTGDEVKKTILQTKNSIFKAYSKLDKKEWSSIKENLKRAAEIYAPLMSDDKVDHNKMFAISKVNIILNELQNSVEIKDEAVFLIKYKNLLEELNNI